MSMDFAELEEISGKILDKKLSLEEKEQYVQRLKEILEADPLDIDALYYIGTYYMLYKDEPENALYYFKKAQEINPDSEYSDTIKSDLDFCKLLIESRIEKNYLGDISGDEAEILDKLSPKVLVISKLIILVLVLIFVCPSLLFSYNDQKMLKKTDYYNVREEAFTQKENNVENQPLPETGSTEGYQNLGINPVSSYNYLSKKQIYDIRKKYVQNSIFASSDYEPNEGVFGGIIDNKPWWGTNPCSKLNYTGDYSYRIKGNSKVSAQVNNPNALVGISMAYSPWEYEYNQDFCSSGAAMFVPTSLRYNPTDKIIVATYRVPSRYTEFKSNVNGKEYGYPLQLSGLNAIDFGYKYVFLSEIKNANLMYPDGSNIRNDVQVFTDYLHLGGSCSYKDGCNNISPMQTDKMFTVTYLPTVITLKLWKEKPINKYSKADFYYKIIIDSND